MAYVTTGHFCTDFDDSRLRCNPKGASQAVYQICKIADLERRTGPPS